MPSPESSPLNEALVGVHQRITSAQVNERQARIEREDAKQRMQEVQRMIRSGESTSDPIRDLVIVRHGLEYPTYEQRYRQLQVDVENHVGEFALVVGKREEVLGHDAPPYMYATEYTLALGLLEHPELIIDPTSDSESGFGLFFNRSGKAELPTNSFALQRNSTNIELIAANIPIDLSHLNEEIEVKGGLSLDRNGKKPKMLEVFIGDEQVAKGFHNLYGLNREKMTEIPTLMLQMAEALGRPINGQTSFVI